MFLRTSTIGFWILSFLVHCGTIEPKVDMELRRIANETYEKVVPCLLSAWMVEDKNRVFAFPDDAEEHYQDLLALTDRFRSVPVHSYAGYNGPWIG